MSQFNWLQHKSMLNYSQQQHMESAFRLCTPIVEQSSMQILPLSPEKDGQKTTNYYSGPLLYLFGYYPTNLGLHQVKQEQMSAEDENSEGQKKRSKLLVLTIDDLQKAGYDKKRTAWTEEEDQHLLQGAKKYGFLDKKPENIPDGASWESVARQIPNRNSKMCYSRLRRLTCDSKKRWTDFQNAMILSIVQKEGLDALSLRENCSKFKERTPKQIKEHYLNYLRPGISREDWTIEEEFRLVQLLNKFGNHKNSWKKIEEALGNRTQNQIKNRFYGRIQKLDREKKAAISKMKRIRKAAK